MHAVATTARDLSARIRIRFGERATGVFLALVCEILIALLLLTLSGPVGHDEDDTQSSVFQAFSVPDAAEEDTKEAEPEAKPRPETPKPVEHRQSPQPRPSPAPSPPAAEPAVEPPPAYIHLTPQQMARTEARPAAPASPPPPAKVYGPPADPRYATNAHDTPRVPGSGPHGEPLYAASWYTEPTDEELDGYLSAARGPGWGLIACKTAPNYRVEDCVKVGEYPDGSGIAQAVLFAAYQFRVRPPRIGGMPQVGAWVRIRIDYGMTLQAPG